MLSLFILKFGLVDFEVINFEERIDSYVANFSG